MENRTVRVRPQLGTRITPALLVRDMRTTLDFYVRLGFSIPQTEEGAPPSNWAEGTRDGVTIWFHTEPPQGTPSEPIFSGTLYFFPDSVEALAQAWRDKVAFAWGPEAMPYGLYEFGIQDPNGYYLAFAEEIVESRS